MNLHLLKGLKVHQVDWVISSLRWLLLVCIVGVLFASPEQGLFSGSFSLSTYTTTIVLLFAAGVYSLLLMLLVAYNVLPRLLPVIALGLDTGMAIGLAIVSPSVRNPLLLFGLFPVIVAALHFNWVAGLFVALLVFGVYGGVSYAYTSEVSPAIWYPIVTDGLFLILVALLTGLIGEGVKRLALRSRLSKEEREIQQLRASHERSRLIFELASTLSATLNYQKVLEAVLDVAQVGVRELLPDADQQVSMVLLFGDRGLEVAAGRRLTYRDQAKIFPGERGAIAQALQRAEPVVTNEPGTDPELGLCVAMHSCRQAVVVPLRAGFETFGVVVLASVLPDVYTADYQDLLIAICNQAVVALQNAQLYQNLAAEKERIVEIEESARKKLARDLHDGPTQTIAAIAMRLNYVQMLLRQDPSQIPQELRAIEELARRTTKEIRQMLFTLRPLILETQGLEPALEQYVQKFAETDPLPIRLEVNGDVDKVLDRNAQGVVFNIIEEALGNARKHARAKNVLVRLVVEPHKFTAEVRDDGVGFDVEAVQARYEERGSLGMVNLRERAELINGKLSIESRPGSGTRILLTVPVVRER